MIRRTRPPRREQSRTTPTSLRTDLPDAGKCVNVGVRENKKEDLKRNLNPGADFLPLGGVDVAVLDRVRLLCYPVLALGLPLLL